MCGWWRRRLEGGSKTSDSCSREWRYSKRSSWGRSSRWRGCKQRASKNVQGQAPLELPPSRLLPPLQQQQHKTQRGKKLVLRPQGLPPPTQARQRAARRLAWERAVRVGLLAAAVTVAQLRLLHRLVALRVQLGRAPGEAVAWAPAQRLSCRAPSTG